MFELSKPEECGSIIKAASASKTGGEGNGGRASSFEDLETSRSGDDGDGEGHTAVSSLPGVTSTTVSASSDPALGPKVVFSIPDFLEKDIACLSEEVKAHLCPAEEPSSKSSFSSPSSATGAKLQTKIPEAKLWQILFLSPSNFPNAFPNVELATLAAIGMMEWCTSWSLDILELVKATSTENESEVLRSISKKTRCLLEKSIVENVSPPPPDGIDRAPVETLIPVCSNQAELMFPAQNGDLTKLIETQHRLFVSGKHGRPTCNSLIVEVITNFVCAFITNIMLKNNWDVAFLALSSQGITVLKIHFFLLV